MTTLAALKAEILSDLAREDQTEAIAQKIKNAITFHNRQNFYFNRRDELDFTLVVGQSLYTSTDNPHIAQIVRIDDLFNVKSNGITRLTRAHGDDIELALGGDMSGEPCEFAYLGQAIRFSIAPDATYTMRVHGQVKVAGPATDAEAGNPWMTEAYDLIRHRTCWDLYAHAMSGGAMALANEHKAAEREQLNVLEGETNMRLATGEITPTEF